MNKIIDREPAEGYVDFPNVRLHYLDWGGHGFPTHFMHGNGFCAGTYAPFLINLVDDLHIIASDARGHGASTHPTGERIRHWRIFADDVQQIINRIFNTPVIGMGHSLGAVSTYISAALYPHLFKTLILIDPVIFPKSQLLKIALAKRAGLRGRFPLARTARLRQKKFMSKKSALQRFTAGHGIFKTWPKKFVEAYLECGLLVKDEETALLRCDPELEAQIFESVPVDVWSYAGKIKCPALILRGEHSDTLSKETTRRLEQINSNFETLTVSGTGHFLTMEKPEACARVIHEYIKKQGLN